MTVRSLLTARSPLVTMRIDRDGYCRFLDLAASPAVGNPYIGEPYWHMADNPWSARGAERFERSSFAAHQTQRPEPDHHESLHEDGSLLIHYGLTRPVDGGGFERRCYEVPVGTPELRRQLGAEAKLIVNLGDSFQGCLVAQTGECYWWPLRLADRQPGATPLQVLGSAPPIWHRQTYQRLGPPKHPINDPHVAEPVFLPGEKRAIVSSMPFQGGAFSLWVIELTPAIWPVAVALNGTR